MIDLTRQIKISLITDTEHPYRRMMQWFFDLWGDLKMVHYKGKVIYFLGDSHNEWVFYSEEDDPHIIWCSLKRYAEFVCIEFGLMKNDVNKVTQAMLEILFEEPGSDEMLTKLAPLITTTAVGTTREITYSVHLSEYMTRY